MPVLPDVLEPNLKVVICGNAAGTTSAKLGQYYAGPGNRFWSTLYQVGLTPRQLTPAEFPTLPGYGIGLTDVAKNASGMDKDLAREHFDRENLRILLEKIERFAPRALAFHGKKGATAFFRAYRNQRPDFGQQAAKIGATTVFVLPQTSGANRANWDRQGYLRYWQALAAFLRACDQAGSS